MKEKKYIISLFGEAILFDKDITHIDIKVRAKSAGFVKIWHDEKIKKMRVSCYGESISLGLAADATVDAKIIEAFLNNE